MGFSDEGSWLKFDQRNLMILPFCLAKHADRLEELVRKTLRVKGSFTVEQSSYVPNSRFWVIDGRGNIHRFEVRE